MTSASGSCSGSDACYCSEVGLHGAILDKSQPTTASLICAYAKKFDIRRRYA